MDHCFDPHTVMILDMYKLSFAALSFLSRITVSIEKDSYKLYLFLPAVLSLS